MDNIGAWRVVIKQIEYVILVLCTWISLGDQTFENIMVSDLTDVPSITTGQKLSSFRRWNCAKPLMFP